jgi:hypothetical protein
VRKCGGFLVAVATFLGLLFVCRQLNQGWVGSNPPCNKGLKMSACRGIVLQNSPASSGSSEIGQE